MVGVPGAVKGGEEEVARAVAREETARAVRSVGGGGESQYHDPRPWVSEAGDGTAPVLLIRVSRLLLAGDLLAPLDEARAASAGNDLRFERREMRFGEMVSLAGGLVQAP